MPLRLLSIELCDVGRFGHRFVDLSGDAVCLVGGNGSGKTTVLSSAYFALTGDLGRLGRRDGAVAQDRASPDSQPYVRLTLSPSGDPADIAVVTRWLPDGTNRSRRRLVHGGRTLVSDSDVDAAVSAWVGLPPAAVSDFVFVAQGRMTSVVDDPPAKRADLLQRLFGVDAADAARESVLLAVKDVPRPTDRAVLAEARARSAELEAAVVDADRRLSEVPSYPESQVAAARALATSDARRQNLLPSLLSAERRLSDLESRAAKAVPENPAAKESELYARSAAWDRYRAVHASWRGRQASAGRARVAADGLAAPPAPGPKPQAADDSLLAAMDLISLCRVGEDCPVCGQSVTDAFDQTKREQAESAAAEIRVRRASYASAMAEWDAARDRYDQYKSEKSKLDAAAAATEAAVGPEPAAPAAPEPTDGECAEVGRLASQYAAAVADVESARRQVPAARADLESLKARTPPAVDEAAAAAAASLVAAHDRAEHDRSRLQGEAAAARRAHAATASFLATAAAAEAAAAAADGWRGILDGAAAVLHRDAAPSAVVRARLAALTSSVNEAAARLGADFTVVVSAGGDLEARRRDGRPVPRLSGGQSAVLALAWRMAMSPGLLCLDEPTYGLDDRRIAHLRDAVAAWRESGTGGQLIVVTHERRLVSAFDRVVEI